MKSFTLLIVLFIACLLVTVLPVNGQESGKPADQQGRIYPPDPAGEPSITPLGPYTPAGSIAVAQDSLYNTYSPQQLVQNVLVTGCLTASNVQFGYYQKTGHQWKWRTHSWQGFPGNRQMAYFNKASSNFPLDEGILLTTGKAKSAMGPNTTGSKSDIMIHPASDPDLAQVTGKTMMDAAVLKFDFVPAGNILEFTYIFASEEYLEYCETQYNDAFGFFLSGPGISGPYTGNAVNLAMLPLNTPVSINTIHPAGTNIYGQSYTAENEQFYRNYPSGSLTMQYDGSTVVMTATYPVVPCSTYHIKLCVADASDQKWDAGVFLGARSFNSENIHLTNFGNFIEGENNIFEGCPNFLRISRDSTELSQPYTVNLILEGSSTNGVDILTASNQPFPTSVTIPANATYVDIPYSAVADDTQDNGETFIVKAISSCPCSGSQVFVSQTIHIYEAAAISSVTMVNAQCQGVPNGSLTVNVSGGSGNFQYSIDNGNTWQIPGQFNGLPPGTYTVLVKDQGSCLPYSTASATVGSVSQISANAGPDATICPGESTQLSGSGGVIFSWSPTVGLSNPGIPNPIASPSVTTTYTLTVTDASGVCLSTDQVTVYVTLCLSPPTGITVNRTILCSDDQGDITLTAIGGSGTTIRWFTGGCGGTSIGTGISLTIPSPASTTTYYAWWENSSSHTTCAQITVFVPDPLTATVNAGTIACFGGSALLTVNASGGTPPYQYSLNGGPYQSNTAFSVTASATPYFVSVRDANGCLFLTDSLIVTQPEPLQLSLVTTIPVSCQGGNDGQITVSAVGGTGTITYSIVPAIGSQSPPGTFISLTAQAYTITATDANACTDDLSVNLAVNIDTIAPEILNCTPPQSVAANANCQATVPDFTTGVVATDNCTPPASLQVTQAPAAGTNVTTGITPILITVTDASGNSVTCSTSFTVSDTMFPVILSCAPPQVAMANEVCQASVPDFTPWITATDNCTSTGNLVITQSPSAGTLVSTGVTTVILTVTDATGHAVTCQTTFTVTDTTSPVITSCPPALSQSANENCQAFLPDFTVSLLVTDNCSTASALSISQTPVAGTPVTLGTTQVQLTVADESGNLVSCFTSFTVIDTTHPNILTCASPQSVMANGNCQGIVPDFTSGLTVSDNCTPAANLQITQQPAAGTLVPTGVTSILLSVTDGAGNQATCTTTFTVNETTPPVIINCAATQSGYADGNCQAVLPDFTPGVLASDNCTASADLIITQSPLAGTIVPTGTTPVVITVSDAVGLSVSCQTNFIVTDTTSPGIVTCAPPQSGFATANCVAVLPDFTGLIQATDNCTADQNLTITQIPVPGTQVPPGTTAVTITVTDESGNTASCASSFTVVDTLAPVILACAPAQTAQADQFCQASLPDFRPLLLASDNCTAPGNLVVSQVPSAGTLVSVGMTTVTLTVTDSGGNQSSCSTTFTVLEITPPVILSCAPPLSGFADANCQALLPDFTAAVSASDNCTPASSLVITQSPAAGTLVPTGITPVILTVTDASGLFVTCLSSFTVQDTTPPVILSCASSQSATANANCQAAVPDFTVGVYATDNCTATSLLTVTQSPVAGTLVSTGPTNIILTVSDQAGNSSSCTTTFWVTETTAPVIVSCATPQSAYANGNCQAVVPDFTAGVVATDNCTPVPNLVITQAPPTGTLVNAGITQIILTVTDAVGLTATCFTTFTVNDTTPPVLISCAPPQAGFANGTCQAAVPDFTPGVSATDNCTASSSLMITQNPASGTMVPTGTTNVLITISDSNGNSTSCTTTFMVTDTIAPVIVTCAPPLSAPANADCQAIVPDFTATVTVNDNCTPAGNLLITQSPAAGNLVSTGITNILLTVTDPFGNVVSCASTFTVYDATPPVILQCATPQSAFANANCQAEVPDFTTGVQASDNCTASAGLIVTQQPTAGTIVSVGTTAVVITVSDAAGNLSTCNTSFIVSDTLSPVILSCAPPQSAIANENCQAILPDFTVGVSASDNCTATPALTITQSPQAGTVVSTGVTNVLITVTDESGNEVNCATSFTVSDTTSPVIINCASPQTAYANEACQAAIPDFTSAVTAVDNCSVMTNLLITQSPLAGTLVSTGTTTVIITVADESGHIATCLTSFIVVDSAAPVIISCASAMSAIANESCQSAVPDFTPTIIASDNCTPLTSLLISQTPLPGTLVSIGTTQVTISVTDAFGNQNSCITTFTVTDTTAPVIISCASPQSAFANASCQATVPDFTAGIAASDNCTPVSSLVVTQSPPAGTLVSLGLTSITVTVSDLSGNASICSTTFTVSDTTAPFILSCSPTQNAVANENCQAVIPDFTPFVNASDNCTPASGLLITQSPSAGTLVSAGTTTVLLTVTDASGNQVTCLTSFTVTDTTAPAIISCAQPLTVMADAQCQAVVPDFTNGITASDNCSASSSLSITQSPAAGTLVNTGITLILLTVSDESGNTASCVTSFTVNDTLSPVILACAPPQSAQANGNCAAAVPDFTASVVASDNCSPVTSLVITQTPVVGTLVPVGVTTVILTVSDALGNTATCTSTFSVTDSTAPVITNCADPQAAFAGMNCQSPVPDFTSGVIATDNCTSSSNLVITQTPGAGTMVSTGITNILITVTDGSGNAVNCSTTFTVTDTIAPVIISCAPPQTAIANENCQASIPDFSPGVIASDNCSSSSGLIISQLPQPGTLVTTGITNVTIIVSDASGLSDTCTTTFTVIDDTPPVIFSCSPPQTVYADSDCQATVPDFTNGLTVFDNCTPASSLTITQSPAAGSQVSTGVTLITLTITDAAGHMVTCTSTLTVADTTVPLILTCPPPRQAMANANCQASVPDFLPDVSAQDNCTPAANLLIAQFPVAGTQVPTGITQVVITVTDASGNHTTCTTSFTVNDTISPVIISCSPPQSAAANGNCQATVPDFTAGVTATDDCTPATDLQVTQSPVAGTLVPTGTATIVITVTDILGNQVSCTTTFTVNDTTAPVILACSPPQNAISDENCQAQVPDFTSTLSAIDNCTSSANLLITQAPLAGTIVSAGVTTVMITVSDSSGNQAICTTTLTVSDTLAPVIVSCAPPQSASANENCQALVPDFTAGITVTDNCTPSSNLIITQSPPTGTLVSTGVTNIVLTVTDASGKSDTCSTTFTVVDNSPPVIFTCSPPQTGYSNDNCQSVLPDFTPGITAVDNCTPSATLLIAQSPPAGTVVSTGVTNVVITVTDATGLAVSCQTTYTVNDTTPPVIVTCAPPQSAYANANCQATMPDFTSGVVASDNCTPAASLLISQSPAAGTLVFVGITAVTLTVTDSSGNMVQCSTSFTVNDTTPPAVINCAPPQTALADANCQAAVPDFTTGITASDNCASPASLLITQSPAAGTLVSSGITNILITVTDPSGNLDTCSTTFTVDDGAPPVIISCSPPQMAYADGNCQALLPDFTPGMQVSDNCTPVSSLLITQSPAAGTVVSTGVTNVTITVTDASNHTASCTTTFTVSDTITPVIISCAQPMTAYADENCQSPLPDFTTGVNASDNCTPQSGLIITQSPATGTLVTTGVTQVILTVSDAFGNLKTCTTTFTVSDTTPPQIVCPPDVTTCDGLSVQLGNPMATDNCGIQGVTNNAPAVFPTGLTLVTWIATDINGLQSTCIQGVTVQPNATASAGADSVICEGSTGFQVTTASASNYSSLSWTTSGAGTLLNSSTLNPTYIPLPNETGNVYLTLTAAGLPPCGPATDQMLLSIIPAPIANAGIDDTLCEGATFIPLTASAAYYNSLSWSSSGTGTFNNPTLLNPTYTPSPEDIDQGSVILTLNAFGSPTCGSRSDAMTLYLVHSPVADAGPDASTCQGIPYTVTGASAQNYTTLSWSHNGSGSLTGAGTLYPMYTPATGETGTITLVLTAIGNTLCGNSLDSMNLVIYGNPVVSAGPDLVSCDASPVTLLNSTAVNTSSLLWSTTGSGTFNDPTLLHPVYTPGTTDLDNGYVILILSATGISPCNNTLDGLTLTLHKSPVANAGPDAMTCSNQPFAFPDASAENADSISWSYTGPGTLSGSHTLHPTYTPIEGESGTVTFIMTVHGFAPCGTAGDTLRLLVNPAAVADAGPDLNTCEQSPVTLSLTTASNYSQFYWTSSGTGYFNDPTLLNPVYVPSLADVDAGSVVLTIRVSGNAPCSEITRSLTLNVLHGPIAYAGDDQVICSGTSYTLTSAIADYYSQLTWTHNGLGQLLNANSLTPTYVPAPGETGSITLTILAQGNLSCSNMTASNDIVLTISQPLIADAGPDQTIPPGTGTILTGSVNGGSGFYAYSWEPSSLLTQPNQPSTATTILSSSTTFTFNVLDLSIGCVSSDQVEILMGAVNQPPVANPDTDTASILNSATIAILSNDFDPDGTIDSVSILEYPSHGSIQWNSDQSITYTPFGGFDGVDSLIYVICDNGMPVLCDTALVTIRVFGTRPFDDIFIYNYLTPNGDSHNDVWIIDNIQFWPENEILLFNRWGDKIRSYEHYDNASVVWDGTNDLGKPVPDGTYYYIIKVKHRDSQTGSMREDARTGYVLVRANRK